MLFLFSKTHTFLRAHHFFRPTLNPLPFSTFTKEITLAKRVFSELQPKPNQPNDSEHLLTRGMIKGQVWVASALGLSPSALRLSVKHPTSYILLLSLISKTPSWRFVSLATIYEQAWAERAVAWG
ncbi:hypothetical protein D9758_016535 [Tetrapyrgos nigripes]|uniref:Uncharacterized protein n=1 Tax=Tetrapyrgos nigripes TaxID=182062 RepID=A0A8H5CD20_9AGAR|nr:hypothetical protein D9758_016535 [Tetrapyrgos nigripes]